MLMNMRRGMVSNNNSYTSDTYENDEKDGNDNDYGDYNEDIDDD